MEVQLQEKMEETHGKMAVMDVKTRETGEEMQEAPERTMKVRQESNQVSKEGNPLIEKLQLLAQIGPRSVLGVL